MNSPRQNEAARAMQVVFVLTCIGALLAFAQSSRPAHGQDASAPAMMQTPSPAASARAKSAGAPVNYLAITALAEADWHPVDRAAIWHALQRRANRADITIEQAARAYASVWRVGLSERTRWKLNVTAECTEPEGWDAEVEGPWSRYVSRCHALFDDAERFERGELANPCRSATDWGGMKLARDHERALRAVKAGRWAMVVCDAPTVNSYFKEVHIVDQMERRK